MATAEQMAAYTAVLREYKPAQDKPLTEVAIFKLKEPQSPDTLEYFESQIIHNTARGKGIKRQCWGFSLSDTQTLIWMLDWDKIQHHWDFWQTSAFESVIACIEKIFVPGPPLVRHYEFKPAEMLDHHVQRILVWKEEKGDQKEIMETDMMKGENKAKSRKEAYAVDMQETNWRCTVLGYDSKEEAEIDEIVAPEGCETHVVELKFAEGSY